MQTLAVLGGTGMTGQCVVEHALKKGLHVKLLYRNEVTIPDSFKEKVELIKGDATRLEDVKKVVENADGVCVILGTRNNLDPTTEMSTGTRNVIDAMKEAGLKKVSICMSSFLFRKPSEVPPQFENINNEHKRMLEITKNSGLDFVCVLPPHIANEPTNEVVVLHDSSPGRMVSKWSLGKFMVDCLEQPEHYGKVCGIAKKIER